MEELVYDITKSFDDGNKDIDFVLTVDEVQDFLTVFLSTGKFKPVSIEWAKPNISGDDREYYFSLCRFDENEILVSPAYNDDRLISIGDDSIVLVSAGVKVDTYSKFVKSYDNVVLFDIED